MLHMPWYCNAQLCGIVVLLVFFNKSSAFRQCRLHWAGVGAQHGFGEVFRVLKCI